MIFIQELCEDPEPTSTFESLESRFFAVVNDEIWNSELFF